MSKLFVATFLLAVLSVMELSVQASVYQWSVTIDEVKARETGKPPRVFLWVPEKCQQVRAVVIAIQNMQEEQVFDHPEFRKTCGELGFAIAWITPPMGSNNFRFDQGEDKVLEDLLKRLAEVSGYSEIASAPLVPMGHSASASWCWDIAAWKPERTLCVLSLSGQWPYFATDHWGGRSVDGVPGLTTKGEFEIGGSLEKGWYAGLKKDFFVAHPNAAFTHVVEPGGGHFEASDDKIRLINLYLRKAVQYRLPAESNPDGSSNLKPIDAAQMGWIYDVWHLNKSPEFPAVSVKNFNHKRDNYYWAFDQELANAIEEFQSAQKNKSNVLLGYMQQNGMTSPTPDHAMVHLKFEPIDDDLTFKLTGAFWDKVPETKDGKKAGWQNMLEIGAAEVRQGDPIRHPDLADSKLTISPICGPVLQKSHDTFVVRFGRIGFDNPKRCNDIWFVQTYPGNNQFKRMVQQAQLKFPLKNTQGKEQQIEFPKIANLRANSRSSIQLSATSNAGMKVHYYVREGPAEVDENGVLSLTPIPPKSRFPIQVTIVAWQWGRSTDPKIQSAVPVEQTFEIIP